MYALVVAAKTFTPDSRVVRSLEPMANTYRPKVVFFEMTYMAAASSAQ